MASKTAPTNVGAPNQTLYCTNLPDKIKKPDLRTALYTLFSTYGAVLDVVAMRSKGMRGQAHIVFRDVQTSTQAMRALQGFDFFGKEMKIVYAKGNSDIIAKLRGTFNPSGMNEDQGISTELQKSIFNAPPSAATATPSVPPKPANGEAAEPAAPQGVKRTREEESDGEAPMDEESDVSMEASSDED
ncbi:U1 small nuclear ribonucleoprotein A [Nannizzia gypsea CBS 118893]|uniref:U1 small nuclear ribonucleoprotein A n=1 Tax=Arthroderma gypseum (strain ATCC MYA-4604 / CBS 118893) TaxID=535722 RepID=E4UWJ7_ARTGP|nr:U1 small nuclear ribonucleoprotein A [Nannizzia gypsea CBS 118893]EFR01753.1 U1 small nuclear ribonucleoprotein A [Nannizzia gypsea CBS 118893]